MDWCMRNSSSDSMVVPKNQELSHKLSVPESWPNWGILESFEFPDNCFAMDAIFAGDTLFYSNGFDNKDGIRCSTHCVNQSSDSSVDGELVEEARAAQTCSWPDYELDSQAELEQMDEIFLTSYFDDVPAQEHNDNASCFASESNSGVLPAHNLCVSTEFGSQNNMGDIRSQGSLKRPKTQPHSSYAGWEKDDVPGSQFTLNKSEQKLLLKGRLDKALVSSGCKSANINSAMDTSLEASLLHEMEMLAAQLNDKTRICLRDAMYRLAKNSEKNPITVNRNGYLSVENLSWTCQVENMRPGQQRTTELDTNTVDRAIASLMFNKMETNTQHCETAPLSYSSNQLHSNGLSQCPPIIVNDAEVPIYGKGEYP